MGSLKQAHESVQRTYGPDSVAVSYMGMGRIPLELSYRWQGLSFKEMVLMCYLRYIQSVQERLKDFDDDDPDPDFVSSVDSEGWFTFSVPQIDKDLEISREVRSKCIQNLVNNEYLETERRGRSIWFRILK